jgi:hypothetical protein
MNENHPPVFSLDFETLSLAELLGSGDVPEFLRQLAQNPQALIVRGMLHRAGRAGFYHWVEQYRDIIGWDERAFRHSPVKTKISIGLGKICEIVGNEKGFKLQLQEDSTHWLIEIQSQPGSSLQYSDYLAGLVQEFCSWAGLGKFYRVKLDGENNAERKTRQIILLKDPIDD